MIEVSRHDGTAFRLDLVVITADPPEKAIAMLADAAIAAHRGLQVTILTGSADALPQSASGNVRVAAFEGESVFHLRARVPAVVRRDAAWVIVIEDHNRLGAEWLERIEAAIRDTGADTAMIIGATRNATSTGYWSWAHFLHTFAFNWAPEFLGRPTATIANIAIRRAALGDAAFELGYLETVLLPALLEGARFDAGFAVDHIQHRGLVEATAAHWNNGRVTGDFLRRHHPRGASHALRHARHVVLSRTRSIARVLATHPGRAAVPRLIMPAVVWFALCHAAGSLAGSLTGAGRAPWRLE